MVRSYGVVEGVASSASREVYGGLDSGERGSSRPEVKKRCEN